MSYKLNGKTAQALTNLRVNADFGQVLEWLKECESDELEHCATREDKELYRAQGARRALHDIREAYENAPATLEKLKSKPIR